MVLFAFYCPVDVKDEVYLHIGHQFQLHVSNHNVVLALCEVSETLTEWKSEIVSYGRTD